jgi:hypothetical protein
MEMIRNNRIGSVVSEMKILKISSPFLFLVTATMLVGGRDYRTQFWKGITHGPFNQSLVYVRFDWPFNFRVRIAKNVDLQVVL